VDSNVGGARVATEFPRRSSRAEYTQQQQHPTDGVADGAGRGRSAGEGRCAARALQRDVRRGEGRALAAHSHRRRRRLVAGGRRGRIVIGFVAALAAGVTAPAAGSQRRTDVDIEGQAGDNRGTLTAQGGRQPQGRTAAQQQQPPQPQPRGGTSPAHLGTPPVRGGQEKQAPAVARGASTQAPS
jgi:hypothetical protein